MGVVPDPDCDASAVIVTNLPCRPVMLSASFSLQDSPTSVHRFRRSARFAKDSMRRCSTLPRMSPPRSLSTGAAVLLLVVLCGCGAPRIDGATEERAHATVSRVRRSVDVRRLAAFDRALEYVMSDGGRALPLLRDPAVRGRIDRKNADEIIGAAERLRRDIERAEQKERTERDLRAIRSSFAAVTAGDHPPNAAPLVFADEKKAATRGEPSSALSSEALYSETPLTDNQQILRLCSRYPEDNIFERRNCEQQELIARKRLLEAIPPTVEPDLASRLRLTCARRAPDSYRQRLACVGNILRMVPYVKKNPKLLDRLPAEYRDDIAHVAGIKP